MVFKCRKTIDDRRTNYASDLWGTGFVLEISKQSQAQKLIGIVSLGVATNFHSLMLFFLLFFLHLVACLLRIEFVCCFKGGKHVVTYVSYLSLAETSHTELAPQVWVLVCV